MLDHYPKRRTATPVAEADPYADRRAELHRMAPPERIIAIEADLKKVAQLATTAATFHRKKLLRMHDAARIEAGLTTHVEIQKENDLFSHLDFTRAKIVWRPRVRA